jgi:hypothetical protein
MYDLSSPYKQIDKHSPKAPITIVYIPAFTLQIRMRTVPDILFPNFQTSQKKCCPKKARQSAPNQSAINQALKKSTGYNTATNSHLFRCKAIVCHRYEKRVKLQTVGLTLSPLSYDLVTDLANRQAITSTYSARKRKK